MVFLYGIVGLTFFHLVQLIYAHDLKASGAG